MSIAGKLKKIFILIILSEITQSPRHTWCVLTLRQADTLMGLELAVQENRHKSLFSLTVQIHNSLEKSVTGKKTGFRQPLKNCPAIRNSHTKRPKAKTVTQ